MRLWLISSFILIFVCPLFSFAQIIELNVKGIEIGASQSEVIEKLGTPLSSKIGGELACETAPVLNMRYPGLMFRLLDSDAGEFYVSKIEVTSTKWIVAPGIKIGVGKEKFISKIGVRKSHRDSEFEVLEYSMIEGWAEFSFKRNKLAVVIWEQNIC